MDSGDGFYSRCRHCGRSESIYRKDYYYADGTVIQHPSRFAICQNPKCIYSIPITVGKQYYVKVDNEKFVWIMLYDSNKTEFFGTNTMSGLWNQNTVGAGERGNIQKVL